MRSGEIFGHPVEREIRGTVVRYRCEECGLSGVEAVEFERYPCDTRGPPPEDRPEPDVEPDPAPDRGL